MRMKKGAAQEEGLDLLTAPLPPWRDGRDALSVFKAGARAKGLRALAVAPFCLP